MKSILDPSFKYTPSHSTNIRLTFQRVREEMEREQALAKAGITTLPTKKVRSK